MPALRIASLAFQRGYAYVIDQAVMARVQDALRQGKLRRAEALTETEVRREGVPLVTRALAGPGKIRPLLEELLADTDPLKSAEALLALAAIAPDQARMRADRFRNKEVSSTTRRFLAAATLHWDPEEAAHVIRAGQERSVGYEARFALDLWDDSSDLVDPAVIEPFLKFTHGRARAERRILLRAWALGRPVRQEPPSISAQINACWWTAPDRAKSLLGQAEQTRELLLNVVGLPELDPKLTTQVLDSLHPEDFIGGLTFEAGAGFLPYISDAQFGELVAKLNGSGAVGLLQAFLRAESGLGPRSKQLLHLAPDAGHKVMEKVLSRTAAELFETRLWLLVQERSPATTWLVGRPEAKRLTANQLRMVAAKAPEALSAPELLPEIWAMRVA